MVGELEMEPDLGIQFLSHSSVCLREEMGEGPLFLHRLCVCLFLVKVPKTNREVNRDYLSIHSPTNSWL